jgi:hypothetical protein
MNETLKTFDRTINAQSTRDEPQGLAGLLKAYFRRHSSFVAVLLLYALSIILVNPLRETPMEDDWAYALTVSHLLDSGEYAPHPWVASNMPAHAAWGAAFAKSFGDSFGVLRISTLVLFAVGLLCFYGLCLEHGITNRTAAALSMTLLASPLVFRFAFNFMTDLPYMSWTLVALFAYTTAWRTSSFAWTSVGFVAAAAAILTRQFGVALLLGLVATWLLAPDRSARFRWMMGATFLPLLACAWQAYRAVASPSWSASEVAPLQQAYLLDLSTSIPNLFSRSIVILHYLALFTLPLIAVAAYAGARAGWGTLALASSSPAGLRRIVRYAAAIGLGGAFFAGLGFAFLQSDFSHGINGRAWLMPYLLWNLGLLQEGSTSLRFGLTVLTFSGGCVVAYAIGRTLIPLKRVQNMPDHERLLHVTYVFILATVLLFIQMGDEYLLILLPYALIAAGKALGPLMERHPRVLLACNVLMLAVSSLWTHGLLSVNEARWAVAETIVRERGVDPLDVYCTWKWTSYHGLKDYGSGAERPLYGTQEEFFSDWLPSYQAAADYWIVDDPIPPNGESWEIIGQEQYWSIFTKRSIYAVKREPVAALMD